jgi:hypothetical protein
MNPRDGRPCNVSWSSAWLLGAALLASCAPALDWRESRPEGSGVVMLFPCRPEKQERMVRVGGAALRMQLHACRAAGSGFSLTVVDVADPAAVGPLLAALRAQAIANVNGAALPRPLPAIVGATPNDQSVLLRIDGKFPDGRPVVEHALFFVKGQRVYQATIIGEHEPPGNEWLENFFAAIRVS